MAEREPPPPREPSDQKDLWRYLTLGTQLALTVAIFVAIGWWVDRRWGWSWGMISFGALGIALGLYYFVKDALR